MTEYHKDFRVVPSILKIWPGYFDIIQFPIYEAGSLDFSICYIDSPTPVSASSVKYNNLIANPPEFVETYKKLDKNLSFFLVIKYEISGGSFLYMYVIRFTDPNVALIFKLTEEFRVEKVASDVDKP